MAHGKVFNDPELFYEDDSEIQAVVDIALIGPDNIRRPILINQEQDLLHLTLDDAIRLHKFLEDAIQFVSEFNQRNIQ